MNIIHTNVLLELLYHVKMLLPNHAFIPLCSWILITHLFNVHFFALQAARMTSLHLSAMGEMVERFLDAAARGDLTQASTLLSNTPSLINQKGYSGWTALMLAARNGHYNVVEMLLSHGYRGLR